MLSDRYARQDLFTQFPELHLQFDPVLATLDQLLEDDAVFQLVRRDFAKRRPRTLTWGRPSTPVEAILRMLVVKRLYGWSYAETEFWVRDSLTLRQFCRLYTHAVPDDTTLLRWARLLQPQTLAQLNDRIVTLARQLQVTRGRHLRVDTTVVQTTIHHPADSTLLGDAVRVLSRLGGQARKLRGRIPALAALGAETFRSRVRSCRRLAQHFGRVARKQGAAATEVLRDGYQRQLQLTRASVRQAERLVVALEAHLQQTPDRAAQRLRDQLQHYLPLVQRGIQQAEQRVLHGAAVPAPEKLLSLFEPHTQVITRHKAGKKVEFGRKVRLDEVEGGIISGYAVVPEGGGTDQAYLEPALDHHQAQFGHVPTLVAADRGFYSAENERLATAKGVKHVVLPATGRVSAARRAHQKTRWFRRGFRFRAGLEGRIYVLQRDYGLDRCPDHGEAGLERWVGWGVLTHNLVQIGRQRRATAAKERS